MLSTLKQDDSSSETHPMGENWDEDVSYRIENVVIREFESKKYLSMREDRAKETVNDSSGKKNEFSSVKLSDDVIFSLRKAAYWWFQLSL